MELPKDGDMKQFYRTELPEAVSIAWQVTTGNDMNTAIYQSLLDPKDPKKYAAAFSCGTMGLCGCTTLVVVSRKGVYATHCWESISFAPDEKWRKPKGKETDDEILNGLS
jgi:hypothetical protein